MRSHKLGYELLFIHQKYSCYWFSVYSDNCFFKAPEFDENILFEYGTNIQYIYIVLKSQVQSMFKSARIYLQL